MWPPAAMPPSSELKGRRDLCRAREAAGSPKLRGTRRWFRWKSAWSVPRKWNRIRYGSRRSELPRRRSKTDSSLLKVWDNICQSDGNFAIELSRNLTLACRIRVTGAFRAIGVASRSGIRPCADSVGQAKNLALINHSDMDRPLFCSNYQLFPEHMDVVQCLPERRGD